ncbi:urease subunit alpha [uncultured Clostridium sp.]|uniref:urease subunit alpha n=1 Tax=uncultured Clostridium sp. TaxID=59620 RepID=UPI00262CC72D|nr:urease subunit alpha [uncultured Clostridium sp.]
MSFDMNRKSYVDMFGPTVGDSFRLADTNLFAQIERDLTKHGDECKFGGGKTLRAGMGVNITESRSNPLVADLIISGVTIIDYTGIYKADIGIRDGKILAIGKGGNPDIMDDVDFIVGIATEALAGEGYIITAGGIDTHVHYINPDITTCALQGGITTLFGGGTGPADGSNAVTSTPGPYHVKGMLRAFEHMPINVGFLAKGGSHDLAPGVEQIEAGAAGIKVHEDWGATRACLDKSLEIADKYDVQVSLHSDTLNEFGFLEDTMDAIGGRGIHTFHTEGAGGGHAPDIIKAAQYLNVLPASTSPTLPYTINTIAEHLDMLMVCHHLDPRIPEDVAFADSRIRHQTIEAEDILHDMGVISMTSSDAMAMGRVGEVVTRTWQVAHHMKNHRGTLEGDSEFADNNRIKRYVAKYTINPAIAQGISEYIGSVEEGKYADLVLWSPQFFGVKPEMIIKKGYISMAVSGDPNASIPTIQPRTLRKMYYAEGKGIADSCLTFVSKVAFDNGIKEELGLERTVLPVHGIRNLTKKDMKLNNVMPVIEVDPQTYEVSVNGEVLKAAPATELPMAQRYFLF